jgi:hypothetical protein
MKDPFGIMISVTILLAVIAIIAAIVNMLLKKQQEQKEKDENAERLFERQMEDEYGKNPNESSTFYKDDFIDPEPEKAEKAPLEKTEEPFMKQYKKSAYEAKTKSPEESSTPFLDREKIGKDKTSTPSYICDMVIQKLKDAGSFKSSEGPCFPVDPSGECLVIRLKKDKMAMIIPRFESEYFILQAIKRFDYVFLVVKGDEILVLNKYSDFIAGNIQIF